MYSVSSKSNRIRCNIETQMHVGRGELSNQVSGDVGNLYGDDVRRRAAWTRGACGTGGTDGTGGRGCAGCSCALCATWHVVAEGADEVSCRTRVRRAAGRSGCTANTQLRAQDTSATSAHLRLRSIRDSQFDILRESYFAKLIILRS